MRLLHYISENNDEILNKFLKETKQYRDEMDGSRLWRAHNKNIDGVEKLKPRGNRKPKDTPQEVHEWLDDWFNKTFGWRARSQAVFAASTPNGIDIFGNNINLIYPINGYKYIWSDTIEDLTGWLDVNDYIEQVGPDKWIVSDKFNDEDSRKTLKERLRLSYYQKNLKKSSSFSTEIMLYCPNGYYLVSGDFFRKNYYEIEGIYTK